MTEADQLTTDLRLQEGLYAAAKMRVDHQAAQAAAEEMARLHHLMFLLEKQEWEENQK